MYVDRIIEVPIEVPVYIEVEKPVLTEALEPEPVEQPSTEEPAVAENVAAEHRKDLIPKSPPSDTKKKKKKNESQRSFGLKLALNQK